MSVMESDIRRPHAARGAGLCKNADNNADSSLPLFRRRRRRHQKSAVSVRGHVATLYPFTSCSKRPPPVIILCCAQRLCDQS
jgi:hypothetical protein